MTTAAREVMTPKAFPSQQVSSVEAELQTMGFDIQRLRFYRWLVTHAREPQLEVGARLSISRFGLLSVADAEPQ